MSRVWLSGVGIHHDDTEGGAIFCDCIVRLYVGDVYISRGHIIRVWLSGAWRTPHYSVCGSI